MQGYGKRYGASLADTESGAFFGRFLFPVLLHEDPRYLRSTSDKTAPRVAYALSRVLVTHDDSGKKRPNLSLMLSAVAASSLANSYYPREDRGFGDTMGRAGVQVFAGKKFGKLLFHFFRSFAHVIKVLAIAIRAAGGHGRGIAAVMANQAMLAAMIGK